MAWGNSRIPHGLGGGRPHGLGADFPSSRAVARRGARDDELPGSGCHGGVVLTLQPLAEPEQLQALQLRAQLRGCELPEETAQFLLRRLPRNMAALCAFLDELDEASLIAQRRLTVPFVKAVMKSA